MSRRWNAGEARIMHRAHQEIARAARAVAGEDAARAIRAMRRGRQADNQQTRVRITKTRHRFAPIDVVTVRGFLLYGDALTVRAQALAALARNDVALNVGQRAL
jgi:hypothetical protein